MAENIIDDIDVDIIRDYEEGEYVKPEPPDLSKEFMDIIYDEEPTIPSPVIDGVTIMQNKISDYDDVRLIEEKTTNVNTNTDIIVEENGIIRNKRNGQFQSGTVGPRYAKKAHALDIILETKLGKDISGALDKLSKIALYDPEEKFPVKGKDGLFTLEKRKRHFYNAQTQLQALTLLCKYYYGNPRKEIQIDQTVDIKIEKKVADLTKLINDNQDRLKVINGGKGGE